MCRGAVFEYKGQIITSFFSSHTATLPVSTFKKATTLVRWGKRPTEDGNFPLGDCAPLEYIKKGRYDQFAPKPVRLPIRKFLERKFDGGYQWYKLLDCNWVQGLLASDGNEHRVYIVTITPTVANADFAQWPRILCA